MEIKYGAGLEFEVEGGQPGEASLTPPAKDAAQSLLMSDTEEALRQIMRHRFREPVSSLQPITLTIADDLYVAFNLSVQGVGVYLHGASQFEEQTCLQGMSLTIAGQSFPVDGTIMHLSTDGTHYLCGILLTRMPPACQDAILMYLQTNRSVIFAS